MLQQSGQLPAGVFDKDPHKKLPGSATAGQCPRAACADNGIHALHRVPLTGVEVDIIRKYCSRLSWLLDLWSL